MYQMEQESSSPRRRIKLLASFGKASRCVAGAMEVEYEMAPRTRIPLSHMNFKTTTLNNNLCIPLIGLGTYKSTPEQLQFAIPEALKLGYRLFDTATVYRNEEAVGKALLESLKPLNLRRDDVFVTSKLAPADQGYCKASLAVDKSLEKLGLEYIDLYLIHWPGTAKLDPSDPLNYENRKESWRALEECVRMGKIKSIGVSNYTLKHLSEMEKYATIKPAVHQFELHPAHVPTEIIKYCQDNAIFIQTYASLGEGALLEPQFLKENTEFAQIASKNGCTVPQLLLKWAFQHSWGIIPKSVNLDRIKENISLDHFNIDYNDLNVLDEFHKKTSFKKCWNSENVV